MQMICSYHLICHFIVFSLSELKSYPFGRSLTTSSIGFLFSCSVLWFSIVSNAVFAYRNCLQAWWLWKFYKQKLLNTYSIQAMIFNSKTWSIIVNFSMAKRRVTFAKLRLIGPGTFHWKDLLIKLHIRMRNTRPKQCQLGIKLIGHFDSSLWLSHQTNVTYEHF